MHSTSEQRIGTDKQTYISVALTLPHTLSLCALKEWGLLLNNSNGSSKMSVKNTTAIKGMCIASAAWYPVVNKGINLAVLQRTALASLLFIFVSLVHFFLCEIHAAWLGAAAERGGCSIYYHLNNAFYASQGEQLLNLGW